MYFMKAKSILYSILFCTAAGLVQIAYAAESRHHLTDEVFAKKAAAGGLTEVELGKLAQQNGDSQDVKDFGAKMVDDHGKANDNLKAVAAKNNLTIPDKPNTEQQTLIDKLGKETGKAFDAAYIRAMVKAHEGDKALFTEEVATAKNPDLKQFASDTLEIVKEHLGMIQGIAEAHGIAGRHHKKESSSTAEASSGSTPPAQTSGDSGAGRSGLAPGSNANSAPNPQ